jgi:hypothetical protein
MPRFCWAITFGRSLLDAFKAGGTSFVRCRPGHAAKEQPYFATLEFLAKPLYSASGFPVGGIEDHGNVFNCSGLAPEVPCPVLR